MPCILFVQRVSNIKFDLKFFMSYQKHVVEDYNIVNVIFGVGLNFENKMYNNFLLDVEVTPSQLKRVCNNFWNRRKTTIVDAFVLLLLVMSFWTYILSIFKTSVLAKVCTCIRLYISMLYTERFLIWYNDDDTKYTLLG